MKEVPGKIIEYLKTEFKNLESIILHGSRAVGYATKHSDWDFVVLVKERQQQEFFRANIDGYNIEFSQVELPISESDIFSKFNIKLQFSKLIYDKSGYGKELLHKADNFYQSGIPQKFRTEEYKTHRKENRIHVLNELKDNINNQAIFQKKIQKIYPQIINEWYWFKKKDFPKNLYISVPQIEKEDTWFSEKVKILYEGGFTCNEKIKAISEMIDYIYN